MYGIPPQQGYGNVGMPGYAGGYATSPYPDASQPTEFAVQENRRQENQASQAPVNRERVSSRNNSGKAEAVSSPQPGMSFRGGSVVSPAHQPKPTEPGLGKLLGLKIEPKKGGAQQPSTRPLGMSLW